MLSSPNTEVLRDGIEAPSTESFPVMKTLTTRTYNTSIQLSPNSSFPTSLEVDTLEKYHPLAVGGPDSVSMGVGICSNDGENIETVNVHIKNGDLVFLDETPKLVKQNESTNVYKVGDVKFVTPSMDIRDFFAQLTRDRAYVGNPELSKFLQGDEFSNTVRKESMKAMCESYEVLGFKHPSDLYEENMYDKYTQAVFGYDVGTVGKDNGYYINVLGKSFAYTRHELDTWNSDRKNVLALINGNIDNEFFRNSHNIPKNPDLAEYMFGESGQKIIDSMFDDEKFSKAFMESDFAEISRLMSEKEGGVTVENGDEPSITFFGQKVVYSPENGSYGGTGGECYMTALMDKKSAQSFIINEIAHRLMNSPGYQE